MDTSSIKLHFLRDWVENKLVKRKKNPYMMLSTMLDTLQAIINYINELINE